MPRFWNAPELRGMASPIIERYHPHLEGYPIRFAWRNPAKTKQGRIVLGTAEIVRGRFASYVMTGEEQSMEGQDDGPAMFWIEIAADEWDSLSESQRKALIDHELSHCDVIETDEGWKMSIKGHDVEEFNSIVQRHGLWKEDLFEFGLTVAEAAAIDSG